METVIKYTPQCEQLEDACGGDAKGERSFHCKEYYEMIPF